METTTGHTLTVDARRGWLRIDGDVDTMQEIPDDELDSACEAAGCERTGEVAPGR